MSLKDNIKHAWNRRYVRWCVYVFVVMLVVLIICNNWIVKSTAGQLYANLDDVPARKVGLVLGTKKKTPRGPNLYFVYRMEAAADLFKKGKVKYLLVSGDNHKKGYDEPSDMREALIGLGVPDSCVFMDYAGFRTFDSMVRCRDVFGEDSITVISQAFHNQRALFIANHEHINAIAYNAREVNNRYSLKTRIREYFARVKCVLDLFLFNTRPHFLGKKIHIGNLTK